MTKLSRRITTMVALLLATGLVVLPSAQAQLPLPLPTGNPTGDPDPEPSPTPTRTRDPEPDPEPSDEPTRDPDGDDDGDRTDGGRKQARPRQVDPVVARGIARWLGRNRTPARTTDRLLELLRRAQPAGDPLTLAEKRVGFGRFPVVGDVWYQDDWLAPRYIPVFHLHEGNDIFAVSGTPVIAVADGTIWNLSSGGSGGNAVWLMGDDGIRYYYGHLRDVRDSLRIGMRVGLGDVLGTIGATGSSAAGTYPHLHFEVNPGGRGTINPKPILDAWLSDAESAAVQRIRSLQLQDALAPLGAARWQALHGILSEPVAEPPALWTAAFDVSATLAWAALALGALLAAGDWSALGGSLRTFSDAGSAHTQFLRPLAMLGSQDDHEGHEGHVD